MSAKISLDIQDNRGQTNNDAPPYAHRKPTQSYEQQQLLFVHYITEYIIVYSQFGCIVSQCS